MAVTYYFSGLDAEKHFRILANEGARGLVNALTVRNPALLKSIAAYPDVPLALDSGAFQGNLNLADYAELITWLNRTFPNRFDWFASLDCIGNQLLTEQRYNQLLRLLPTSLHHRVLWIWQCPRGNGSTRQSRLDQLAQASTKHVDIGLGGLVPILRRNRQEALCLLQDVGQILSDAPPTSVHVFGVASPEILFWLRLQPWFKSADSSKWTIGFTGHEVLRLSGAQRKIAELGLPMSAAECAAVNVRTILNWLAGRTPQELIFPDYNEETVWAPAVVHQFDVERFLLRHHGRRVLFDYPGEPLSRPRQGLYIPLFTRLRREYGLIDWPHLWEPGSNHDQEWCVIWDPLRWVPDERIVAIDGIPKSGLRDHDDSLCHFPFHTASAVAVALAP